VRAEHAPAVAAQIRAAVPAGASVAEDVAAIIAAVRARGDDAVREYEARFGAPRGDAAAGDGTAVGDGTVTAHYSGSPEYVHTVNLIRLHSNGQVQVEQAALNGHTTR